MMVWTRFAFITPACSRHVAATRTRLDITTPTHSACSPQAVKLNESNIFLNTQSKQKYIRSLKF
jgi:hypothetical protein